MLDQKLLFGTLCYAMPEVAQNLTRRGKREANSRRSCLHVETYSSFVKLKIEMRFVGIQQSHLL